MRIALFFWTLQILMPLPSLGGGADMAGNGGGAVVCRSAQREILHTELLDLWEGEHVPLRVSPDVKTILTISRTEDPVATQVARAFQKLSRIDPVLHSQVQDAYRTVFAKTVEALPEGSEFASPQDALPLVLKSGCNLEKVAHYDDSFEVLTINHRIPLSKTDEAAMQVHEAIYKAFREYAHLTDSVKARHLTAYLFATEEFPGPKVGVPNHALFCSDDDEQTSFFLYSAGSRIRLQFTSLAGVRTWTQTYVDARLDGWAGSKNVLDWTTQSYDSPTLVSSNVSLRSAEGLQYVTLKQFGSAEWGHAIELHCRVR